jgi:ABC-type glycerol-3-phosphate transport system permease component
VNALQAILVALFGVFCVLYMRSPKNPRQALKFGKITLLVLASIAVLSPFAWLVAAAFKDESVLNEYLLLPPPAEWSDKTLNLNNYRELFAPTEMVYFKIPFWRFILNSTVYTTVSVCAQVLLSSLGGFALAKYEFKGKRVLMLFILGSMMVPNVLLVAPIYKMAVAFDLVDTLSGLTLQGIASAYGIFLFRQACLSVPDEMLDAGRIDGCSELRLYFSLVMPLVRPMTAAFCLVSFLNNWNSFFTPNVFLHSYENLTLPIVLRGYLSGYANHMGVFLAGTLLAMVPPAVLFFALQREFISGLTSGALKG